MNKRSILAPALVLFLVMELTGSAGAVSTDVFRVRHPEQSRPIGHVPRSQYAWTLPPLMSKGSPTTESSKRERHGFMARIPAPNPGFAGTVDHDVRLTPTYRILQGELSESNLDGLFVRILRVNPPENANPVLAEGYLDEGGSFTLGPVPSSWLRGETVRIRPVIYLKTPRVAGSLFSGGLPEKIYRLQGDVVEIQIPRRAFHLRLGTLRINPRPVQERLVERFTRYVRNRKSNQKPVVQRKIEAFSGSESVLLPLVHPRTSSVETGGDTQP